jgi:two-component system, LytTR family, response regulator
MIKALIVDDDIQVVGEASSGAEAVTAVRELSPDLMFLDVQMPGLDAFEVLESVRPNGVPSVIFVTAHGKYAVKAFEAHALHFLLKPIEDDQFKEALQRARRELSSEETRSNASRNVGRFLDTREIDTLHTANGKAASRAPQRPLTRLAVKDRDDFVLVDLKDVDWIESAGNYAKVHVGGRTFLIRMIFSELEEKLDAVAFARISRSIIVNVSRVQKIKTLWHGDFQVVLKDETVLRMSRRYRRRLIP